MKKIVVTLLLAFYSLTAFSQHSFIQSLKGVATITFPDTPKTKIGSADTIYVLQGNNHMVYLAQSATLKKSLKDMLNSNILNSTYNDVISGTLDGAHGKLIYKKDFSINELRGVEFGYKGKAKGNVFYGHNRVLYFNNALITYCVMSTDSLKSDDKLLNDFFSTFKLTIKDDNVRQDNVSDIAFHVGQVIGILLIIAVVALFGFCVVLIIRKMTS